MEPALKYSFQLISGRTIVPAGSFNNLPGSCQTLLHLVYAPQVNLLYVPGKHIFLCCKILKHAQQKCSRAAAQIKNGNFRTGKIRLFPDVKKKLIEYWENLHQICGR